MKYMEGNIVHTHIANKCSIILELPHIDWYTCTYMYSTYTLYMDSIYGAEEKELYHKMK